MGERKRRAAERPERLGDGPIEERFRGVMNALAHSLDEIFNGKTPGGRRKTGFVLMVFPFGDGDDHRANYVSNAKREDVVIMLREQLARFEGQPEVSGRA
jgi:hypothetical protein